MSELAGVVRQGCPLEVWADEEVGLLARRLGHAAHLLDHLQRWTRCDQQGVRVEDALSKQRQGQGARQTVRRGSSAVPTGERSLHNRR